MSSGRKITLKSSDGESFEVDEAVALESQTIQHMIEDDCADIEIPFPSEILAKVIEYCKKHGDAAPKSNDRSSSSGDDELKNWDADFVKVDSDTTIIYLINAAYSLEIENLLELTSQTLVKGKTADEIYKLLSIKNDFTPEEDEELRRENAWAFE